MVIAAPNRRNIGLSDIKHFWNLVSGPGEVRELRAPKTAQRTISGYYENGNSFSLDAASLSGKAPGIYLTINPVNPDLIARASNRLKPYSDFTTSDADILARKFILIDIDPKRPPGISSTDAEQRQAFEMADRIETYLTSRGCPADSFIKISTGNGSAFWLRVDLPNDNNSTDLIKRFLESLDFQFSDNAVDIDTSVINAARIAKIPGTLACKGDNTRERPHRLAHIIKAPEILKITPKAVLESIAADLPAKPPLSNLNGSRLDISNWLAKNGIPVLRVKEWKGSQVYEIVCQWNPEHNHGEAYVIQFHNGAVDAGCHHHSCQGKTWADLRELKDPGYRDHKGIHNESSGDSLNRLQDNILTDTTNAEFIAELYGEHLRYDHLRDRWLVWAKHYWQEDSDGEVYRLAINAARERYKRSIDIPDLKERQRVASWAIASEQRGRLEAAVSLAKNILPIADNGKDWDADPWLFAVANGVVDLHTGQLRDGKRPDRITMHSNVIYDPEAKSPRWLQFLSEIFNNDMDLVDWIWRNLGYAMTGTTQEQIFYDGYGIGANGKGRFQGALREVFGDYAYDAPFSTFELISRSAIPNDLAALERRRLVTSSETNDGARLNEARIKSLSGEDPCTARYLHHEFFTFKPVCKIWLFVNHKPTVRDDSYGFWRRVRLIPFLRQFKGDEADKNLTEKLFSEAPGILNWLIAGCLEWQKRGLDPIPVAVVSATEAYKIESDPLSQFIADACEDSLQEDIKASTVYKAYVNWAVDQGIPEKERLSSTAFGRRMKAKYSKKDKKDGAYYQGLSIKGGGFGGGFRLDVAENEVSPLLLEPREENMENPPQPTTPTTETDINVRLGMSVNEALNLWCKEGAPIIFLGRGENCVDLEILLTKTIPRDYQIQAVKEWLDKKTNTMSR